MSFLRSTLVVAVLNILIASSASAYAEKTYECANQPGLPKNVYKIKNVSLSGITVPYVEVQRYYRQDLGNENSAILESMIRGFATVASLEPGTEILFIAQIQLEFKGDVLLNCH
jgi:hypothetical protein